jgi:hypothetical protein
VEHRTYPLLPDCMRSSSKCCAVRASRLTCRTALKYEASLILARYALTRSTDVKRPVASPSEVVSMLIFRRDGRSEGSGSHIGVGSEERENVILGRSTSIIFGRAFENEDCKRDRTAENAIIHTRPPRRNGTKFC